MKTNLPWIVVILIFALMVGCKKENKISSNPDHTLDFSLDTVLFDTVFTTIGSTTHILKVYNNNDEAVNISDINVAGGESSNFQVNVDGDSGYSFEDIEIGANDSIFIFVEVTVDINNVNGPMVIEDYLTFLTNGNAQEVLLVAWGVDACFHHPQNFLGSLGVSCLDDDGDCFNGAAPVNVTWDNTKPHVIYGYLIVDEFDKLTIEAGTQVHFHSGSGLWVWEGGQIIVQGTVNDKVVFQGDRLEHIYDDVPGQWDLIRINQGPAGDNNEFTHAIIKNSIIGIQATPLVINPEQADNASMSDNKLILNNVIIQDNSDVSLFARNYQVDATNCVFANAGRFVGLFQGAGTYNINHCTFANYWTETTRNDAGFYISNRYPNEFDTDINMIHSIQPSTFKNSIMYGNNFEEFGYDFDTSDPGITVDVHFADNLYKLDETIITNAFFTPDLQYSNNNPGFVDVNSRNFHLIEGAYAIDKGISGTNQDLDNVFRDTNPDLGAYEWVE